MATPTKQAAANLAIKGAKFVDLIDDINRIHFRLADLVSELHADMEMHNGHRAILRNLVELGPQTAPQLAAMRPVARQYVQRLINDLKRLGYAAMKLNPKHKRSQFVVATAKGRRALTAMAQREYELFSNLVDAFNLGELRAAQSMLNRLVDGLDRKSVV